MKRHAPPLDDHHRDIPGLHAHHEHHQSAPVQLERGQGLHGRVLRLRLALHAQFVGPARDEHPHVRSHQKMHTPCQPRPKCTYPKEELAFKVRETKVSLRPGVKPSQFVLQFYSTVICQNYQISDSKSQRFPWKSRK